MNINRYTRAIIVSFFLGSSMGLFAFFGSNQNGGHQQGRKIIASVEKYVEEQVAQQTEQVNRICDESKTVIMKILDEYMSKIEESQLNVPDGSHFLKKIDQVVKKEDYIGGLPEEVEAIIERGNPGNKEHYDRFEVELPKAVLFTGPPGTGKTLLAKVIAGEWQVPFFELSNVFGSHFGEQEQKLNQAFEAARVMAQNNEHKTAVVFIDEIDHLGRQRGTKEGWSAHNGVVTVLLTQIDGISNKKSAAQLESAVTDGKIIVIGATNHKEALDTALLSRFDTVIHIGLPDIDKRSRLLESSLKAKNVPVSSSINFKLFAQAMEGMSGRDISSIAMNARKLAAYQKSSTVTTEHVEQAASDKLGYAISLRKAAFLPISNPSISDFKANREFLLADSWW